MKRIKLRRVLATALSALIVAGCGALQPNSVPESVVPASVNPAIKVTNDWVFVSDPGTAQVFVYTLPRLKLIEIATGFKQPQGECSDSAGNVWVTDGSAKTIYELQHSGKIVRQLSDTSGNPIGCAWDPKTGNLAVMNYLGSNSQGGAVLVYHNAKGVPNVYYNSKQFNYEFGGYDDASNLFFDGLNASGRFMLSELPAGATAAKTVAVSGGKIYAPGMVQWDGSTNDLVVGDQNCEKATVSCVYRMTIGKSEANITGQTMLENGSGGPICDMIQGTLWNKSLVGSDFDFCGSASSATYVWPYPQGGKPHDANAQNASQPFGAAISVRTTDDSRPVVPDSIAKKVDLLYISDGNGQVTVYTYWQKTLVAQLTGFTKPEGECSDTAGNVFITDAGAHDILEYAHDGKQPMATLADGSYAPYGCSINPVTGALAVANEAGNSKNGNLAIYAHASGTPKFYTDTNIKNFQACAYDAAGNLLASDGEADGRYSYFAWLPKNGAKLVDVNLPGPLSSWTWEAVNGIQWDGRYWVIDSYSLYRVSIANGQGYYVGETGLQDFGGQPGPFWIYNIHPKKQGTQVVGPYDEFSSSYVDYWNYPAGADAIASITKGIDAPVGVTVSLGKIHE